MPNPQPPSHADDLQDPQRIGSAVRYSFGFILAIVAVIATAWGVGLFRKPKPTSSGPAAVQPPSFRTTLGRPLPALPWTDITAQAGIDFLLENGAAGEKLLPETMCGGCAFLDYNNDNAPDILIVGAKRWNHDLADAPQHPQGTSLALYENDGHGNFRDVTAAVGLETVLYGQGCAVGDFDNDGWVDIFISAVSEPQSNGQPARQGPHRLFRNQEGKFVDVTDSAGVAGQPGDWGSSCGWFDFDNDGHLDLWVCQYLQWSREDDLGQDFRLTGGQRAYGRPQAFAGSYPRLFRNDGDGRFTEVSAPAGLRIGSNTTGSPLAKSLGLAFHDFDADGHLDVMVANDTVQNQLFRNLGDGTFEEIAAVSGVAFDTNGNARGAMGIDIQPARRDHRCACIVIGNFANEMSAYFVSGPDSTIFSDAAIANGLGPSTRLFLTFGVLFLDVDLDGWLDIFHANGHLEDEIANVQTSQTYRQAPQLFWNAGPESLTEYVPVSPELTGSDFAVPLVGRGATYADIDGDGDLDLLIVGIGSVPRLLRNDQQTGNHWLRIKLIGNGQTTNRDAIGTKVEVITTGGRIIRRFVSPTRGYLSQVELPITIGLGQDTVRQLQIQWPDGSEQTVDHPEINHTVEITQDHGLGTTIP